MATYSAFFSSGLLAPQHFPNYQSFQDFSTKAHSYDDAPSPATPSSPLRDSDMELDIEREVTPTPNALPRTNSASSFSSQTSSKAGASVSNNHQLPQPRLRKRRSSITVASNPMNAIRSPARAASAALQLQMHLTSPSRSRSGSLSVAAHPDTYTKGEIASQATGIMGRMRSGSVGTALRPHRGVRRLASVPAAAPPPTAPLPALPSHLVSTSQQRNSPLSAPLSGSFSPNNAAPSLPLLPHPSDATIGSSRPPLTVRTLSAANPMTYRTQTITKGRDRSFSLSQALTIDEEMKEN